MTGPAPATPQPLTDPTAGRQPANLGDILERVLDKGIVIVGDIKVNLLDIELLTVKVRLLVASVETARQLGIDWWQHDPWLSSGPVTAPPRSAALPHGTRRPEARAAVDPRGEPETLDAVAAEEDPAS